MAQYSSRNRFSPKILQSRSLLYHGYPMSSGLTAVGAIRRFLGPGSSRSDSLVSRLPSTLPVTDDGRLITPDIGVSGGVDHGCPPNDELDAVTLGTLPIIGVGLLTTGCEASVAIEDIELDLAGLWGGGGAGDCMRTGVGGFSNERGADGAVGVCSGVG